MSELIFLWITGVDNCSFQSYLKHGRSYAYRQLTTTPFGATKILPTVRVDISDNRSSKTFHLRQSQLSELLELTFLSTFRIDNSHFKTYLRKYYQLICRFLIFVLITFAVSYTKALENTWTRSLQNLCCHIKVPFIVEFFLREANELSTDTWKIIGVTKLHYNALANLSVIIKFLLFVFPCSFSLYYIMGFTS